MVLFKPHAISKAVPVQASVTILSLVCLIPLLSMFTRQHPTLVFPKNPTILSLDPKKIFLNKAGKVEDQLKVARSVAEKLVLLIRKTPTVNSFVVPIAHG